METMEDEIDLALSYKLVPWSSWEQWNFVRESLFSSSPALVSKALQRIAAWRSRGCLPVPIDVTAAFIEIQQKDPFFREGANDDSMKSEELLSMLYCMAIIRLVNGLVEHAHKRTGRSISELANAVGIPRGLVDIRHESSHRGLPSLPLVRLASMKALDWLKSNYWEPQRYAFPDVRKEIRSRLRNMISFLKTKHSVSRLRSTQISTKRAKRLGVQITCCKLSSQITGQPRVAKCDGPKQLFSKMAKRIIRLYSSYPSEVVSVLLEFFYCQAPDSSGVINMEHLDDSNIDDSGFFVRSMSDLKTIIMEVSSKKPGLILSILKDLLEIMETNETTQSDKGICHFPASNYESKLPEISHLCSLVHWLLKKLKILKESCRIEVISEGPVLSTNRNAAPKVSLTNLLRKCLSLSVLGDKHLSDSVLLLAEMIGNDSLTNKLKKLPMLHSQDQELQDNLMSCDTENIFLQEDASIEQATQKLEFLKLHLRNRSCKSGNKDATDGPWTLCKSWIPCPIGMLPCSFSSTAVLPVLDKVNEGTVLIKAGMNNVNEGTELIKAGMNSDKVVAEIDANCFVNDHINANGESYGISDENESARKRLKMSREVQESDLPKKMDPFEGHLLIGGIWKKVTEDELAAIESNIRIFV